MQKAAKLDLPLDHLRLSWVVVCLLVEDTDMIGACMCFSQSDDFFSQFNK